MTVSNRTLNIAFILILIFTYYILYNIVLIYPHKLDFTSLYAAVLSLKNNRNPYGVLLSNFLPPIKELTSNLNPPAVLWIFRPLANFSYHTALIIWVTLSFILGLIGASIAFYYTFSLNFLKKYWLILYLLYLSFIPTIINIVLAQIGFFLLFFLMIGYHFFLTKRPILAGILWGFVIAIKLFPALLFFYVFKHKRMQVFIIMLSSFLVLSFMPIIVYGVDIYSQYFTLMQRVFWYGDNWNASIYGFIFRLSDYHYKQSLDILYAVLFLILLIGYFRSLQPNKITPINHQSFSLTLAMMLLISPLGWLYYFPILIFPLALTWAQAMKEIKSANKAILIWLLCLFFINFPQGYVFAKNMQDYTVRLVFFSFYFYGLALLSYYLAKNKIISGNNEITCNQQEGIYLFITCFILMFGTIAITLKIILTG